MTLLSPGVEAKEINLSTVISQAVSTSRGATVGKFSWGPVNQITQITSEDELIRIFGKPSDYTAASYWSSVNFLKYATDLRVVRIADPATATNASAYGHGIDYVIDTAGTGYVVGDTVDLEDGVGGSQIETLTISGTPTGNTIVVHGQTIDLNSGTKQVEDLVFTGSSNSGKIRIDDGMGAVTYTVTKKGATGQIAKEIAYELEKHDYYEAVSCVNNIVTVTWKYPKPHTGFKAKTQAGLTLTPTIKVEGKLPDNVALIAKKIRDKLSGTGEFSSAVLTGNKIKLTRNVSGAVDKIQSTTAHGVVVNSAIDEVGITSTVVSSGTITAVGAGGEIEAISIPSQPVIDYFGDGPIDYALTGWVVSITSAGSGGAITPSLIEHSNVFFANETEAYDAVALQSEYDVLDKFSVPPVYARYPGDNGNKITVDIISYTDWNDDKTQTITAYPTGGTYTVNFGGYLEHGPQNSKQCGFIVYYGGEVVETHVVSTDPNDTDIYGLNIYLNEYFKKGTSQYIYAIAENWVPGFTGRLELGGGNESGAGSAEYLIGWDMFADPETIYINLLIAGGASSEPLTDSSTIQKYIVDSVAGVRRDCLALISPPMELVVGITPATAIQNVIDWRRGKDSNGDPVADNLNVNTSFAVVDNSFKYQYDKYRDQYFWVGFSADIAGLCAYTDSVAYAWYSPAGLNRGQIKGVKKLAYDTKQANRDALYESQINAVVNFSGQGYFLYGDKTMETKPSAFDRINVRRLFNVLEKAIGDAAKYKLFELNDAFLRNSFRTEISAYLETIKARRGITDFYVQCDENNNPPAIIDSNQFVASIFVQPARSVNFITLNFVATSTGVSFDEVLGAV